MSIVLRIRIIAGSESCRLFFKHPAVDNSNSKPGRSAPEHLEAFVHPTHRGGTRRKSEVDMSIITTAEPPNKELLLSRND